MRLPASSSMCVIISFSGGKGIVWEIKTEASSDYTEPSGFNVAEKVRVETLKAGMVTLPEVIPFFFIHVISETHTKIVRYWQALLWEGRVILEM